MNMNLKWQPDGPDGTSTDSLLRALREQLGLELKPDSAKMSMYTVANAVKMPIKN